MSRYSNSPSGNVNSCWFLELAENREKEMIVIASYVLSIVAALLGVNYVIKEPNKKKGMAFALVAGASAAIGLFAPQIGFWVFMAELALFVGALVRDISHVRW